MHFYNVKSVEETLQIIGREVGGITESERRPLAKARGYVLSNDLLSPENVPGFTRSTVDGYAVRARDTYGSSETSPQFLQVVGEVHMGEEVNRPLAAGEAMYIPTGGMLPPDSDSVIMIEYCEDLSGMLNTYRQVAPGENVIRLGEDVRQGDTLLAKGTRLRPQELGILASVGLTEVDVFRKIRVGYLSSGDEIVPYQKERLNVGEVRDMNEITVSSFIEEWGGEVLLGGIVKDDFESFRQKAEELFAEVDFLILSGGSSVGAKDYTTEVIQSLGDPGVLVHGVSVKPGKPTIFSMANGKPVLGLPGHPASAVVIFLLFGRAIMSKRQGESEKILPRRIQARISQNIPSSPGRADYIRVRLTRENDEWWAHPVLGKSGLLSTLVQSDGLVEIESPKEGVQRGEWVPVLPLR